MTDRTGAVTTYTYDAINRVTEIHRPNGMSTYNTYNARDQITDMKNICDDCEWTISEYHYTYDDRDFIVGEDVTESLYAYAWDDKHDGKHENWHDDKFPHGDKHINKHAKDGIYNFQIIGTKRNFEYDDDGKLIRATEKEDRQGTYVYDYEYDDMGNRTFFKKSRNGVVQESAEYTYNAANQMVAARLYDGKHYKDVEYTYDADGNRIMQEEVKPDGNRKVELTYDYSVENRLKAVHEKNDLLVAMAYDGDGNWIFQLNYNLHTDDDWKGNSGNGNGNNKDNSGSGNKGNNSGNGTGSKKGILTSIGNFFGMDDGTEEPEETLEVSTATNAKEKKSNGNKDKDKGNNGNDKNNGKGNGNGNSGNNGNGNSGNHENGNGNTSTGGNNDNNGNANGNTNNTGGSQNQSGILFPIDGEVSELEAELIGMIKTTGKEKNYELVEYVNDVNREHVEVLMELNINGIMDTAYSYGNERLTNERFTEWTGYYTYDPRGSVTGVTDSKGMIWQSYRYNANGDLTFGKPQYNNVYSYNAESYNPNMESQYLRARYYNVAHANFLTEDSYLGNITDPLTLNRYNYVKSSPLNYIDPSGHRSYGIGAPQNLTDPHNYETPNYEAVFGKDWNQSTNKLVEQLERGNITFSKPGSELQLSISLAKDRGEVNVCELGKQVGSFLLGMYMANQNYTMNPLNFGIDQWGMQKFARSLLAIGETYVAKNYLDTEMYYTGKYVVDAYKYATSKAEADAFNLLYNIITGGDTAALTEMGVWGGGAASMSSVKVLANGDTLVETGTAEGAAVIIGGVLILGMGASTNAASRENMQEDQDRINAEKENAKTDIPEKNLSDLPQNAQEAYKNYDNAGWKGNTPGQTQGTAAGGKYQNRDGKLPTTDSQGNPITYKEWDVNNKQPGATRDGERFVTGSDGSVYYTDSHYGEGSSLTGSAPFVKIH